jgi:Flp pilus assembly protein TadB
VIFVFIGCIAIATAAIALSVSEFRRERRERRIFKRFKPDGWYKVGRDADWRQDIR